MTETQRDESNGTRDASRLSSMKVGSTVWWNDPDLGMSSGYFQIVDVLNEDGAIGLDDMVVLKNGEGTEAEVFGRELELSRPAALLPVLALDVVEPGDDPGYFVFGNVFNQEDANRVAELVTDDETMQASRAVSVRLFDGSIVVDAWVVHPPLPKG